MKEFFNLYRHGFVRLAVATPQVRVGDPAHNGAASGRLMREAARERALLAVFPELGLSAYTCEDLFHQRALTDECEASLGLLLKSSKNLSLAALVGLPVAVDGLLYNCAALICRGRLVGVVPKTYLPNYREFYERRQFTPGDVCRHTEIELAGQVAPFGSGLLFKCREIPEFVLHVEICEDLWVPAPPSSFAALAGATVIANLSASNVTVGKHGYRRELAANQSARCLAAYLYSAAGLGESTTDLAWDGDAMVFENGNLLAESRRFSNEPQLAVADIDLGRLLADRMRQNTFADSARRHAEPHPQPGLAADARGRRRGRGDRHPALVHADAERPAPSLCQGPQGVRRHVRERAGGRAHQPSLPPRQPAPRPGRGHRGPLRARARLGDLRRRRPHVALQRERERAEDAHSISHPLGGGIGRGHRRREASAAPRPRHRDQPRAGARQANHP